MGKHTKIKHVEPAAEAIPSSILALASRSVTLLDRMLTVTEAAIESSDVAPAVIREATGLARVIIALQTEERQREKQERAAMLEFTHDKVLAWAVAKLDTVDRGRLVRDIQAIDSKRSGLA